LQNFWARSLPPLAAMRSGLLESVVAYIVARWGEDARDSVAAHNPLVDCVYAAIVLEGLKRHEPTAAMVAGLLGAAPAGRGGTRRLLRHRYKQIRQ